MVQQPFDRLGTGAARLVFAGLDGEGPAWPVVLGPELVVRELVRRGPAGLRRHPLPDEDIVSCA